MRVLVAILPVMVFDAVIRGHERSDHLDQLVAEVGTVQAGGHENENLAAGDAGRFQCLKNRRQQDRIGHRPGDVADDDAGVAAPRGQLPEGRRSARVGQAPPHGRLRIGRRLRRTALETADDVSIGQFHFEAFAAVCQMHPHGQ